MSVKKIEERLESYFGGTHWKEIVKEYYRYKPNTERLGGSLSTLLQNRIRKHYKKSDPTIRLLEKKEGPHIPVTNYCGPGTNLDAADEAGVVQNPKYKKLDTICQAHDHMYAHVAEDSELSKAEKKQAIIDADRIMLEKIDNIPDDEKDKWYKLARKGIALKNLVEEKTPFTIYGGYAGEASGGALAGVPVSGGCVSCGGSLNLDIEKYIQGLVETVVQNNMDSVKDLYELRLRDIETVDEYDKPKSVVGINETTIEIHHPEDLKQFLWSNRKKNKLESYEFKIYPTAYYGKMRDYLKEQNSIFTVKDENIELDLDTPIVWAPLPKMEGRLTNDIIELYVGFFRIKNEFNKYLTIYYDTDSLDYMASVTTIPDVRKTENVLKEVYSVTYNKNKDTITFHTRRVFFYNLLVEFGFVADSGKKEKLNFDNFFSNTESVNLFKKVRKDVKINVKDKAWANISYKRVKSETTTKSKK